MIRASQSEGDRNNASKVSQDNRVQEVDSVTLAGVTDRLHEGMNHAQRVRRVHS